jgi:hypothetical protein
MEKSFAGAGLLSLYHEQFRRWQSRDQRINVLEISPMSCGDALACRRPSAQLWRSARG